MTPKNIAVSFARPGKPESFGYFYVYIEVGMIRSIERSENYWGTSKTGKIHIERPPRA